MKDADFIAKAKAFLAEPGDPRDAEENLATILSNVYRDGVNAERKRQKRNRVLLTTRNSMGDVRSPYQPGKLHGR